MSFTASVEKALPTLLTPIIRMCIRHAVKIGAIEAAIKEVLVQEAKAYLTMSNQQQSVSKISVMTGLQRPAVASLIGSQAQAPKAQSLMAKVISAWQSKKQFSTSAGQPRVLSYEGKESDFARLVTSVSQALNPYTVLYELERAKLVERTPRGLKLLSRSFLSRHDIAQSLEFLAMDINDLTTSVEENIFEEADVPHHHLTTEYDAIPAEKEGVIRQLLLREGEKFHMRMRKLLGRFDRGEKRSTSRGATVRIAVCSFGSSEKMPTIKD